MTPSAKILVVSSEFPPQPGGIGNQAFHLARELFDNRCDVQVLTNARSSDGMEEREFDSKLHFKAHRTKRRRGILRVWTYIARLHHFRKARSMFRPDRILASGKFSLWLVGFFGRNCYKAAIIHGSEVNRPGLISSFLTRSALKRFDSVIAVSEYTADLINNWRLNHLSVIHNGYTRSNQGNKNIQVKGTPSLITVGSITRRKGQHNVIRALPELVKRFPGIHYHMIGAPVDAERILELGRKLDVGDHITVHGIRNDDYVNSFLEVSDICIMLSEKTKKGEVEGFGIAMLEANHFGTPGIGSLGCGLEDAIDPNSSGLLVEADNSMQIVKAVEEIMTKYDMFSSNARAWAQRFTWDRVIEKYKKVMDL